MPVLMSLAVMAGSLVASAPAQAAANYDTTVKNDSPVRFFPMHDKAAWGDTAEPSGCDSSSLATGTVSNATGIIPNAPAGSTTWSGNNARYDINQGNTGAGCTQINMSATSQWTYELWWNSTYVSAVTAIIGNYNGGNNPRWYLNENTDGTLEAVFNDNTNGMGDMTITSGSAYNSGNHQIDLEYDGTSGVTLYVDGFSVGTISHTFTHSQTDGTHPSVEVGGRNIYDGLGNEYNMHGGGLESLSVFNKILTPDQINTHYAAANVRSAMGLPYSNDNGQLYSTLNVLPYGQVAVGPNFDTGDKNQYTAVQVGTGADGLSDMTQWCAYVGTLDTNKNINMAIYTDLTGSPNSLKVTTGGLTLTTGNAWNCFYVPGSAIDLAANTTYWIVYNTNGDNDLAYFSTGNTSNRPNSGQTYGSYLSSYPSPNTNGTKGYAMYVSN